jgi:repressor LexA
MPKTLAELLKKKKLTQAELAKAVKLAPSTIANYEIGRRTPNLQTAKKIARVLGVRVDTIIFGSEGCDMTPNQEPTRTTQAG